MGCGYWGYSHVKLINFKPCHMVAIEGTKIVDNLRHWNFSICSTNKGVATILVKGCNPKSARSQYDATFYILGFDFNTTTHLDTCQGILKMLISWMSFLSLDIA